MTFHTYSRNKPRRIELGKGTLPSPSNLTNYFNFNVRSEILTSASSSIVFLYLSKASIHSSSNVSRCDGFLIYSFAHTGEPTHILRRIVTEDVVASPSASIKKFFQFHILTSSNEVIDVTQRNNPKANCASEDKHSHTLHQSITFFIVTSL